MVQAIVTKFLKVTNTKGARIKATCAYGSITLDYYSAPDNKQGCEARNRWVAEQLIIKLNRERSADQSLWYITEPEGLVMPDGTGYAFGACLW